MTTLTKQSILQRPGWSQTIVQKLLGEPDERKSRGSRYAPLCLYSLERVEQAEASQPFAAVQAKREAASARALAAEEKKRAELLAAIDEMPIRVQIVENPQKRAIESYNRRQMDLGRYENSNASDTSDPAFLRRITVNYIRHELTEYDAHLDSTFGLIGTDVANARIRVRVLIAIAAAYPDLRDESLNQMRPLNHRAESNGGWS
jgi:hypothetical protein